MSDQRYAVAIAHGDSVKHYSEQFQTQARAVAGAECNTVIELKRAHRAA